MNVKGLKDICGQEFVAEIISDNGSTFTIKNPIYFVPVEQGMMPVPYLMTTKSEVKINKSSLVLDPFDVVDNISNTYKQMFGGIVEPPNGIIV